MSVLADGRFWAGLLIGIALYYGWQQYQARKAQ